MGRNSPIFQRAQVPVAHPQTVHAHFEAKDFFTATSYPNTTITTLPWMFVSRATRGSDNRHTGSNDLYFGGSLKTWGGPNFTVSLFFGGSRLERGFW